MFLELSFPIYNLYMRVRIYSWLNPHIIYHKFGILRGYIQLCLLHCVLGLYSTRQLSTAFYSVPFNII